MLGCAILAAVAAGLFPDIRSAVRDMVHIDKIIQPNPEAVEQYQPY